MKNSNIIQRFIAAGLLLLFSFCVTPKRVLHDLLANHRDAQTSSHLPIEQITASGFHCHIDDLVVVAPFLPDIGFVITGVNASTPFYFSEPLSSIALTYLSHTDGRGPPAHFCI